MISVRHDTKADGLREEVRQFTGGELTEVP